MAQSPYVNWSKLMVNLFTPLVNYQFFILSAVNFSKIKSLKHVVKKTVSYSSWLFLLQNMLVLKGEIDCWPPLWELKCSCMNKNITVGFYQKKIDKIVWLNYTTAYTMVCSWLSSLSSPSLLKLVYMQAIHKKVLCFSVFSFQWCLKTESNVGSKCYSIVP